MRARCETFPEEGDLVIKLPAKKKRSTLQRIAILVGLGLASAAVIKELPLPRDERTWHGQVL